MLGRGFASSLGRSFAHWGMPAPLPVTLPAGWSAFDQSPGGFVGPLMAQAWLAGGALAVLENGGARIGSALLISAAGKPYAFKSAAALAMWASINKARALRELELAAGLTADRRAVWLTIKRATLATYSAQVLAAAARGKYPAAQADLIRESEFAAAKWGHYP
jgi:hypothetical protein